MTSPPDATRTSPDQLLARLRELGIAFTRHDHRAVFTVAESRDINAALPGGHSKNLFLKDRKGRLFLVVAAQETAVDLKKLGRVIGASGGVSFGSSELLGEILGVEPGSVTPFGVVNDRAGRVTVVLDRDLMSQDPVNFHPLVNTATLSLRPADLLAFLRAVGHEPQLLDLPSPAGVCDG